MKKNTNTFPVLIFLILLSLFIFILDTKGFFKPLKAFVENLTIPVKEDIYNRRINLINQFSFLSSSRETKIQLDQLKQDYLKLLNNKVLLDSCLKENSDIRRLLGAPLPSSWQFSPARIIGREGGELIVDKGKEDGVKENAIVVYDNVLIGKTVSVSEKISRIKTVFVADLKIPVNVKSASDQGNIAKGLVSSPSGKIRLGRVLMEEKIGAGDFVATSGEAGYPADLLIGKIANIDKKASNIFQEADIDYLLDFNQLNNVFIILKE